MGGRNKQPQTLCWTCANACGGCSWSAYKVWKPVKGWDAEPTTLMTRTTIKGVRAVRHIDSYIVKACPQYVPDRRIEIEEEIPMARMNWTEEQTAELLRLRKEGLTYSEIAKRLGGDAKAVHNKLAYLDAKAEGSAQVSAEATAEESPRHSQSECHGRLSSKCNTLKENFGGRFPTKTLTRTVVDDAFDELNRLDSDRSEVKAFWEEKTDNIVGVLVRSTLPWLMRLSKVNKSG